MYLVLTNLEIKKAKEIVEKVSTLLKKGLSKKDEEQLVDKLNALNANAKLICYPLNDKFDKYSFITNYNFQIITKLKALKI